MKKIRKKFPKALVKEYGEQTYRDSKSTKHKLDDAAWPSVFVAWGVGQIIEEEQENFRKVIVDYAKTTKFPKNFV